MIGFKKMYSIQEAFKDIGKVSPEELSKGYKLISTDSDNFNEVPARLFYNSITQIKHNDLSRGENGKGLDTLTVYNVSEYNKMRCFIGKNNSSGYALHHDELVSVFSSQHSSGEAIVKDAIMNGAKHLDCFATREKDGAISGGLFSLYSKCGFKIDKSLTTGVEGEPYSIQNGVSSYVNDDGVVEPNNPSVVIFMKI